MTEPEKPPCQHEWLPIGVARQQCEHCGLEVDRSLCACCQAPSTKSFDVESGGLFGAATHNVVNLCDACAGKSPEELLRVLAQITAR